MGTPSTHVNGWQYSRWVYNIARNAKQTEPIGVELATFKTFIKVFWNPVTQTGTRPWLENIFSRRAETPTTDYVCNIDVQPAHVLVKLVGIIGRDLKKVPITDAEVIPVAILLGGTNYRALGTAPYFGSVGGSLVSIP